MHKPHAGASKEFNTWESVVPRIPEDSKIKMREDVTNVYLVNIMSMSSLNVK